MFDWLFGILAEPLWAGIFGLAALTFWVASVYHKNGVFSFLGVAFVASLSMFIFNFNPITFAVAHPWYAVGAIVAYGLIGFCWMYVNWRYIFMTKVDNAMFGLPDEWKEEYPRNSFEIYARNHLRSKGILTAYQKWPIDVREHIGAITLWLVYWPASIIWTVFGDLLQTLCIRVVVKMSDHFQRIANQNAESFQTLAKLK